MSPKHRPVKVGVTLVQIICAECLVKWPCLSFQTNVRLSGVRAESAAGNGSSMPSTNGEAAAVEALSDARS